MPLLQHHAALLAATWWLPLVLGAALAVVLLAAVVRAAGCRSTTCELTTRAGWHALLAGREARLHQSMAQWEALRRAVGQPAGQPAGQATGQPASPFTGQTADRGQPTGQPGPLPVSPLAALAPDGSARMPYRLLIVAAVRDVAEHLPYWTRLLEFTGGFFREWRAALVEDGSTDGSGALLEAWAAQQPPGRVAVRTGARPPPPPSAAAAPCHHTPGLGSRNFPRFRRIAAARNAALRLAAEAHGTEAQQGGWTPDLLLVVDGDVAWWDPWGLLALLAAAPLPDTPGAPLPWAGACAQGLDMDGRYYDSLAHRPAGSTAVPGQLGFDAWRWRMKTGLRAAPHAAAYRGAGLPVRSCFGGAAVYPWVAVAGARYDEATCDCEHVAWADALPAPGMVMWPPWLVLHGGH